jgi:sulfite reductase (NADPH) flavoprotein alpha-component
MPTKRKRAGSAAGATFRARQVRRVRHARVVRVPITVLYATASGNAEQLAASTAERLGAAGWSVSLHNAADFPASRLREVPLVLIIASTWGDGGPPPDAAEFCAALVRDEPLGVERLRYAVLALGSSMYAQFCGCGRTIDERLAAHGALRLLPRVDADTKYKGAFGRWLGAVEEALSSLR